MKQVIIENPVINSPCSEPQRHFKFGERGPSMRLSKGGSKVSISLRIGLCHFSTNERHQKYTSKKLRLLN